MKKDKDNDKEISVGLIILLLIIMPPIGVFLALIKFGLPILKSVLFAVLGEKHNRYSTYEKDSEDVFKDIWNSPSAKHNNTGKAGTAGKTGAAGASGGAGNARTSSSDTASNAKSAETGTDKKSAKSEKKADKKEIVQKIPYKIASTVLLIIAGFFAFSGVLIFIDSIGLIGSPMFFNEIIDGLSVSAVAAVTGIIGFSLRSKMKLAKKYISIIGTRGAVTVTEIADALSVSKSKVKKELQKVIDMGVFGEYAYIDLGSNTFLRDSSYKPAAEPKEFEKSAEQDGDEYAATIRKIRRLNDDILDERVSDRITLIEGYTERIFDYVKKNPDCEKNVHSFMTYYLPTTLKLLESYSEIERVGVAGDNMKSAKESIENTLDLLVEAFKRLLDKLYESDNIDISTDIDVLEQMMKKDGLSGKGLEI